MATAPLASIEVEMNDPFNRNHQPRIGVATELEDGIRVITAPNASPMTFTGTQTYIVGQGHVAIIDPGPQDATHLNAILAATKGEVISHIFVTHSHLDHSPLAAELAIVTGAPVLAFGDSFEHRNRIMDELALQGDLGGQEGIDAAFKPDVRLLDNEVVTGEGWALSTIATPGHFSNHMCFSWAEAGAVFSGDHVMGWATTMVSPPDGDLNAFMKSLDVMANRHQDRVYYPGHGAEIQDPLNMVNHQVKHRKMREGQILSALEGGSADAQELARKIYTDVDPRLLPAAARNVLSHLIDLTGQGLLKTDRAIAKNARFRVA